MTNRETMSNRKTITKHKVKSYLYIINMVTIIILMSACTAHKINPDNSTKRKFFLDIPPYYQNPQILSQYIAEKAKKLLPTYVSFTVKDKKNSHSADHAETPNILASASAFAIDNKGHFVTAAHATTKIGLPILARAPNGKIYRGNVVAIKKQSDIALIKINQNINTISVKPDQNPCLKPGDPVITLGFNGKTKDTIRIGNIIKISAEKRITYSKDGKKKPKGENKYGYQNPIEIKVASRMGESGGPVFNKKGNIIGMIVANLLIKNQPINVAHAIPTPKIAQFICQNIQCTKQWKDLSRKNTKLCPK